MNVRKYVQTFESRLAAAAKPGEAEGMRRYMQDQFEFLGVKRPARHAAARAYFKEAGSPSAAELPAVLRQFWKARPRQMQYAGQDLLIKCRNDFDAQTIDLIEELIVTKSWWDTVDMLASNAAGHWFKTFPETIVARTGAWIRSPNLWLRRSALLFQLKYKAAANADLLFEYCRRCASDPDFFIRKGIGWALREYAKTNPRAVKQFLKKTDLSPLSVREAGKRLF